MLYQHRLSKQLPIARIAIVRSLPGLGDLLCAVPAMRALRGAFPQAKITLIGLPWARSFVERFRHYLDEFLEFPGYPGIPEVPLDVRKLPEFLASTQQQRFDLALQMHGSGIVSNSFTVLLGARVNAGFYLPNNYCPDPDYFLPYPEQEPEVWRHLRLIDYLGIPLLGDDLEFPLQEEDFSALHKIESVRRLQKNEYICVHPGASVSERRWSPEKFAVVADALAARGFQVVLSGTAKEANLTRAVAEMMRFKPIDLAGSTNLGALAALLSQARILICNDTGVSHLAAALKVKSVVIFSNSEVQRWAPLNREIHRVLSPEVKVVSSEWLGCLEEDKLIAPSSISCHLAIAPEMVISQVDDLLRKEVANAT